MRQKEALTSSRPRDRYPIGRLCAQPGAQFHFSCRPCNVALSQTAAQVLARFDAALPFDHYRDRVGCPICKLGHDGDQRVLTYSCTTDDPRYGWSGPKA